MRSVNSRAPWWSSCSSVCVRSILVRPGGCRVRSGAFGPFRCALGVLGCVRSIPVHPRGRQVRSCAIGPFPYALGIVGCARVRSVHSRARWGSSGSFVWVRSIPMRFGGRRVRSGPFALWVVWFVRVLSAHSRAPWES